MHINTVFIDVGGVLVRTENTKRRRDWEQKLHLKSRQLTKEIAKIQPAKEATIGLVTAEKIWQNVAKKYSLNSTNLEILREDFFAGERLNLEFYQYVLRLHKKLKVVLFSNVWDDGREVYTKKFGLDKLCDQMILSAEEGMRKPHKKFFKRALLLMSTTPAESIFVDDRLENIKAGREMGLNCIQFKNTKDTITQLNALI